MEMWDALETAVEQGDWARAAKLAQLYADEWPAVRDLMLLFAADGAEAWAKAIDDVLAGLVLSLEGHPIDADAVEEMMARARLFVRADTVEGDG